ncbi:hypothetical protein M1N63_00175 [Thermodesulfovibrionales bacterium]|nr:hypothetical protein [Thermodesulfovibrionales bacterium]
MWMDVYGTDEHVGDIATWRAERNVVTDTFTYEGTYDPINLDMDSGLTLRGELTRMEEQWGFGMSGWWFGTDDSKSGKVTSLGRVTPDIFSETAVCMWDHTIEPVTNELEASGWSPVDFWTENELDVWTTDIFGIRTLAEKPESYINFTFGLKLGSLDIDQKLGQKQHGFDFDFDYDYEYNFGPGYHLDNRITMKSKSRADYGFMTDPAIGFQGEASLGKVRLEGFINQSVLFGEVDYSGLWTDINDMWVVTGPEGGPFERVRRVDYRDGSFPFSKSEDVALPVTELKLKVVHDVRDDISIGVGGFCSIWWDAPLAPKWSMPGDWVPDEGKGWKLQEGTLRFVGTMATFEYRF